MIYKSLCLMLTEAEANNLLKISEDLIEAAVAAKDYETAEQLINNLKWNRKDIEKEFKAKEEEE